MPTLIAFAGLPGTGKTTVARELARQLGAVYLRIDAIEQALRTSRSFAGEIEDAGYRAAIALAQDNLAQGLDVVTDAVNPLTLTRDAFAGPPASCRPLLPTYRHRVHHMSPEFHDAADV